MGEHTPQVLSLVHPSPFTSVALRGTSQGALLYRILLPETSTCEAQRVMLTTFPHPTWHGELIASLSLRITLMYEIGVYRKRSHETLKEETQVGEVGDVGENKTTNEPVGVE